ncbi:MAG: ATP-binding cassette domain-containing protein [Sedimentisphaerales bacterium]|nr:ATP-binding cassette domain-containing protein [Sedimentisphaerales bacterium]
MDAIVLDNVTKSFGPVRAVDSLSVRVPTGCIYGFLGPNGAGKTTAIRMIMNIIQPDSGRIVVLQNGPLEENRQRIGYMPEERGLYRKMTAGKVLSYFGSIKGISPRECDRHARQWLERVELIDHIDKKVEELSRGMHQKLQFAVTAINEPDLLILDEPFSGLDPVNLDLLKDIIQDMRARGKTIIFSTHVMHEAERLCDYILLINKGRSVLDGTLEDIRSRKKSHAVVARLAGDTEFLKSHPLVEAVAMQEKNLEITLIPRASPQELLKDLVGRVEVQRFEVKQPSLHELFIQLVKEQNAQ